MYYAKKVHYNFCWIYSIRLVWTAKQLKSLTKLNLNLVMFKLLQLGNDLCCWTVGWNQRPQRKPTQTWKKTCKFYTKRPEPTYLGIKPRTFLAERQECYPLSHHTTLWHTLSLSHIDNSADHASLPYKTITTALF